MNAKTRIIIGFFWVVAFVFIGLGCKDELRAGSKAPNFTLRNLFGEKITLSDYRGNFVVLDFWATWCAPCRVSIPELVKSYNKYKDKGLVVFGISLDDPKMATTRYLRAFKKRYKIRYDILRYDQRIILDYFGRRPPPIPTMILIDRKGRIVERITGFRPGAYEKAVSQFF